MRYVLFKVVIAIALGQLARGAIAQEVDVHEPNINSGFGFFWNLQVRGDLHLTATQLGQVESSFRKLEEDRINSMNVIFREYESRRSRAGEDLIERNIVNKWKEDADADAWKNYHMAINSSIKRILTAEQLERTKQLLLWDALNNQNGGFRTFLLNKSVSNYLDIDTNQKREIKELADKLQAEFESELFELRQEFRERVVKDLPANHQKKIAEALGGDSRLGMPVFEF
jgi:hypothetical protein